MSASHGWAWCVALALAVSASGSLAGGEPPVAAPISQAERRLFVDDHLSGVQAPTTLSYDFAKAGSLEPGHRDELRLALNAGSAGKCCVATGQFARDPSRWSLPRIEGATANPVVLYFLEHDVREMNRLTGGQPNYFRKRIRLSLVDAATLGETTIQYRGRSVPAVEIRVTPYAHDPMRARYERFASKQYVFVLADGVPGGVYQLRTVLPSADGSPLIDESLTLKDAAATPTVR